LAAFGVVLHCSGKAPLTETRIMRNLFYQLLGVMLLIGGSVPAARAGDLTGRVTVGGRPVRDAVVFIEDLKTPPVERRAMMDQYNRTFVPHVMVVQLGTRVEFPNHDTVFHNVFSYRDGKKFDLGLYPVGSTHTQRFDQPGLVRIFCNIHSNMSAFIWVVDNPYFAKTDKTGHFHLTGVPPGRRTVRIWHERSGMDRVSVDVRREGNTPLEVSLGPR
jgi:plastocyanin